MDLSCLILFLKGVLCLPLEYKNTATIYNRATSALLGTSYRGEANPAAPRLAPLGLSPCQPPRQTRADRARRALATRLRSPGASVPSPQRSFGAGQGRAGGGGSALRRPTAARPPQPPSRHPPRERAPRLPQAPCKSPPRCPGAPYPAPARRC